ncbi:MAG: 5'-nucleotidase SurE [Marinobacterium sp. xm-d-530]|jgi:5'-nucleotidase|nr:MAG: 5'-nucleotidase SurE [Marinobacterium sp. xm-d-530]
MHILVSNDDGVYAPGLRVLAERLKEAGHRCTVVAPDRNRSGASNSLTLDRPLDAILHSSGYFGVDGTPTDCVHLGVSGIFSDGDIPDIVVSGINAGANLGDDIVYSGTVAAATEGRHLALPPIAVSTCNFHPKHYETAAQVVTDLVANIESLNVAPRTVINVNVPDVALDQLKGVQITRLGHRSAGEPPLPTQDPRGRTRYWIAAVGEAKDRVEGTDFYAVENGYVAVTPLQLDMTRYSDLDQVADWLEQS